MLITRLSLLNFRNFETLTFDFSNGINFILGENASGKTNLIEAIYYLSSTRSFKRNNDRDLVNFNKKFASLGLNYSSLKEGDHSLKIDILEQGKIVYVDDDKQKSVMSVIGKLPVIAYDPYSTFLFRDDPQSRRKMIDESLSTISQNYLYSLARYKKLLKERNIALNQHYDEDVIEVLTEELIKLSYVITKERIKFIEDINKFIAPIYKEIFDKSDELRLDYITNVKFDENYEEFFKKNKTQFDLYKTEERIKCVTLLGNHRDDLVAYIGKKNVAIYCSQGQNRLVTLALKFALGKLYEKKFGEQPIFLLDDVLSDLDEERKENIILYLKKQGQVFITGTKEIESIQNVYELKDNKLTRKER